MSCFPRGNTPRVPGSLLSPKQEALNKPSEPRSFNETKQRKQPHRHPQSFTPANTPADTPAAFGASPHRPDEDGHLAERFRRARDRRLRKHFAPCNEIGFFYLVPMSSSVEGIETARDRRLRKHSAPCNEIGFFYPAKTKHQAAPTRRPRTRASGPTPRPPGAVLFVLCALAPAPQGGDGGGGGAASAPPGPTWITYMHVHVCMCVYVDECIDKLIDGYHVMVYRCTHIP